MRSTMIPLMAALALSACKPQGPTSQFEDADLTDPDVVHDLATAVSAPNAYAVAVLLVVALDPEGTCPAPSAGPDADTTVYTGSCTDEYGNTWFGKATVQVEGDEVGAITYQDFGSEGPADCSGGGTVTVRTTLDGTVTVSSGGSFTIDVTGEGADLDSDACTTTPVELALVYEGASVEGTGGITTWSGSGEYGNTTLGRVDAVTVDEVIDGYACDSEAQSGTTTLTTKDHEAVITYDGAADCDPESTVTWTLDGADQGEMEGVACSTSAAGLGTWAWVAAIAGLGRRRARAAA